MTNAASGGSRLQHWFDAQRRRPAAPTRAWYGALAFGIATLLCGARLASVFPATGAGFADGYGTPVIAFEFARGQADLLAIFGPESDPMQVPRLAAMRAGNEGDYLFLLFYAGFVGCGLFALWRELRSRVLFAAVALPVAAALCDAWENALLFDIQAAFTLGDYSPAMASLPGPVAAKFILLALANIAVGHGMMQLGRRWQLPAALATAPVIAVAMALAAPPAFGWTLGAAIGAGWIGLLLLAAIGSWRALVRRRPLVDFEGPAPRRRAQAPDTAPVRRSFGRKR